ncbi:UDP-N-acetylmuramate dehydrogenase [Undibacterium sp. Jales W-56]|uniref:UDP-N-acetylmuramate dehydrogenase n=1 Tax=Undibacterium sp. Jales W-56 TaxID=2897325 RepID=UPI0021CE16E1|nr:UDP-N-acetylmuramate dehydrogenase [Undibacterium sp. Jales W-56]MCU6435515.1 UDP-N-acetylmuramate dehydrogenase [Undibacterium sp. Jales W-56]
MTNKFSLFYDYPLQKLNTFGIAAQAKYFVQINRPEQLAALRADPFLSSLPRLILGGGSNLVLSDQVDALVVQMHCLGKRVIGEDDSHVLVQAEAGEGWHELVLWTLAQGYGGLENLSLIPGTVGAAPIQNIGAYGVEMQDLFHSLSAFDCTTGETIVMDKAACQFAYRDSIFKHAYKDRMVILNVTFALPKQWQARLNYAEVARYLATGGIDAPCARDISDAIIAIRQSKLPDPQLIGNAGSFFKNPIVSTSVRDRLMAEFPGLVSYSQPGGDYKLAAGWLIEQSGWKGKALGRVGAYQKQALVLVNLGGATGAEVRHLAQEIQSTVKKKFDVELEIEPVFF